MRGKSPDDCSADVIIMLSGVKGDFGDSSFFY